MSNYQQISPQQLDLLLKMAGKQLRIDPNILKQQLESGDLSSISAKLGGQTGQQLNQLLSNPQKAQQMVSQMDLQQLLKNLK